LKVILQLLFAGTLVMILPTTTAYPKFVDRPRASGSPAERQGNPGNMLIGTTNHP